MVDKAHFLLKFSDQFADNESSKFDYETEFQQTETWDSLTSMAIISMIEHEYNVVISDDEIRESTTIEDIYNIVNNK